MDVEYCIRNLPSIYSHFGSARSHFDSVRADRVSSDGKSHAASSSDVLSASDVAGSGGAVSPAASAQMTSAEPAAASGLT